MGLWVAPQGHEHLKLATAGWHPSTFEDEASNLNTDVPDFSEVFGKGLVAGLHLDPRWLHPVSLSFDLLEIKSENPGEATTSPQITTPSFMEHRLGP